MVFSCESPSYKVALPVLEIKKLWFVSCRLELCTVLFNNVVFFFSSVTFKITKNLDCYSRFAILTQLKMPCHIEWVLFCCLVKVWSIANWALNFCLPKMFRSKRKCTLILSARTLFVSFLSGKSSLDANKHFKNPNIIKNIQRSSRMMAICKVHFRDPWIIFKIKN